MPRTSLILLLITGIAAAPIARAADRSERLAAGEENARQLLTEMDADKDGKVSKAEFMHFMEQEFERLDVNKDGMLDVAELTKMLPHRGIGAHR
jgi:Ca2+-binding EF-hand superfamily protein